MSTPVVGGEISKEVRKCKSDKTYSDVGHCAQVVNLVGLDFRDDVEEICGVRQIPIMKEEAHASLTIRS